MTAVKTKIASGKKPEGETTSKDYLEVAAYYRWQARGCPWGDPLTDWLEAEKEWRFWKSHSRNKWRWFRPDAVPLLGKIFPT